MRPEQQLNAPPIAIVGVSALFPGSSDSRGFWRDILAGSDLITDVPESHWLISDYYDPDPTTPDKTYCKRGGFLSPVAFDPVAFGMPPSTLPATDTTQLLALIVAQQVLEDAFADQFKAMDKSRMSVILGVTSGQELFIQLASRLQRPNWLMGLRQAGVPEAEAQAVCDRIAETYQPWQEASFPGLLGNVVAGRIANRFDLGGTNCVTDAACASSLSALSMAISELYLGHSDVVITGGADTFNDIGMYMCFSKTPAFSPSGDCRPFSDQADGTIIGEGLGMFALKRLADAERDGDRVYAVLKGLGAASDGRAMSVYAPLPEGQARALNRAYEAAGYGPETVELVEAHGTGTRAGDAAEFEGLRQAFGAAAGDRAGWCALGSVKSQIGHTKAAAGAAGLFKAVMALHHQVLPPTIKIDRPNPKLDLASSPFYLNTQPRPWVRDAAHPRRASVSSFGFGGSNFHVALEEYTGPGQRPGRTRARQSELVLASAGSREALAAEARRLASGATPGRLAHLARQSQLAFDAAHPARLAIVATDEADLAKKLEAALQRLGAGADEAFELPGGVFYGTGAPDGGLAWLFPGQGSQYVGMGAEVAMAFPAARRVWDSAASAGLPLHTRVFPAPALDAEAREAQTRALTATDWAQPAIGAMSLSLLALLRPMGLAPDAVGGHSFGELSALHAAGVVDAADTLAIARTRGELMAAASAHAQGAMSAVDRPAAEVRRLLEGCGASVVIANDNSPRQVVISGEAAAVAEAARHLEGHGATVRPLPVATAFHSSLVSPSVSPYREALGARSFTPAALPVYGNADASPYPADPAAVRERLAEQIARPVRFVEMIEAMHAAGVRTFLEVGPGSVLSGLTADILQGRPHRAVSLDRKGRSGLVSLWHGLGQLAVAGHALDFAPLWAEDDLGPDPADRRPGKFEIMLSGANYQKRYPPEGGQAALPAPNPPRPVAAPAPVQVAAPAIAPAPAPAPMAAPVPAPAPAPVAPAAGAVPAEAFIAFQQSLSQGHTAYMRAMEAALAAYGGSAPVAAAPAMAASVMAAPVMPAPAVPAAIAPVAPAVVAPAPAPAPAPVAAPAPLPTPVAAPSPRIDLQQLMLSVVSEKTGYPTDMLDLSMALEADLGIDSIKRVEILSAMQDRVPGLPPVDPTAMAKLRTLAEIVGYMDAQAPVSAPAAPTPAPAAPSPGVDLHQLMLTIVSEKTGYPTDMLDLDMALEADLGIDSIKRVEILSAMQDRVPGLPEVDPTAMAKLRTLAEIVAYMTERGAVSAPATAPQAAAAPGVDLKQLMLDIVSEKTGYPTDMLDLEMGLEADLGIDSIKRVEILSAMQDRVPGLPEVDPTAMAKLRTLAEIVAYMGPQAAAPAPSAPVAAPTVDLQKLMLEIVAEKTGYPTDMLDLNMALEADLGIDSIKRVEILSAMQDRVPGLPEVDPTAMAKLRTLAEIVGYMQGPGVPVALTATVPADSVAAAPAAGPQRLTLVAVDAPAQGFATLQPGTVHLVEADHAIGRRLAERLRAAGFEPRSAETVPPEADQVVFLGALGPVADAADAFAVQRRAFAAAKAVAGRARAFVTVQDTGGHFGLEGPSAAPAWLGGLPGLVKTAGLEWPEATCRAIDLERDGRPDEASADALADELFAGGCEPEVGLRTGGRRVAPALRAGRAEGGVPAVDADSVIVASGGARGVTAACLIELARRARPRIALLGRTPLVPEPACCRGLEGEAALKQALLTQARAEGGAPTPAELGERVRGILANREVEATLAALAQAGSEARYLAVDVRDPRALGEAMASVRAAWGPVTGLVHGAGVLADKAIADKTPEQFDRVFDTKVRGLEALFDALADDPLTMIALFSSVAGRTGNVGQSDYAMANEVLNKVAQAEALSRPEALVKSFGWGPWAGGMVTPALKAHFERQGVALLGIADGASLFADELLQGPRDQVELVLGGSLPRSEEAGARARWLVSRRTHPALADHAIQGTPVLPVVLVLDAFARAGRGFFPGWHLVSLEGLQVLKGVRLTGFDGAGDRFTLRAHELDAPDGTRRAALTLTDEDGVPRYRAEAVLATAPEAAPAAPAIAELPADPRPVADLYDGLLFHGPAFQVLQAPVGLAPRAATATVGGCEPWAGGPWATDPAALDGGLQLALVFGAQPGGKASLPTAIRRARLFVPGPWAGPVRVALSAGEVGAHRTVSDLAFLDAVGKLLALLEGAEMHLGVSFKAEAAAEHA